MVKNPADRQLIRAINRSMVLNVVRESGPISKAEIARSTGLSQATVGIIVRSLIERRLISESESTHSGVGRPPTLLQLDPDSYNVIGLKLMSDHIVGAVSDLEARTLGQTEVSVNDLDPHAVAEKAAEAVGQLLETSDLGIDRLLGVGIGMGGIVDSSRGVCVNSPFFGWENVPIGEVIEARIGKPVRVDNDVNTLALAERWFGVGQKVDDFLLVTIGRGVGLSVVAAGRVYRGSHGGAGEFGHTVLGTSDALCDCGNRGCLEAIIAQPALVARARAIAQDLGLAAPTSAAELYAAAAAIPAFKALLADAGRDLGRSLGNLINLFAPAMIILSGEGVDAGEALIEAARAEMATHVHEGLLGTYELVIEPLSDDTWARGAASLILDAIFEPPTQTQAAPMWEWETAGL